MLIRGLEQEAKINDNWTSLLLEDRRPVALTQLPDDLTCIKVAFKDHSVYLYTHPYSEVCL